MYILKFRFIAIVNVAFILLLSCGPEKNNGNTSSSTVKGSNSCMAIWFSNLKNPKDRSSGDPAYRNVEKFTGPNPTLFCVIRLGLGSGNCVVKCQDEPTNVIFCETDQFGACQIFKEKVYVTALASASE